VGVLSEAEEEPRLAGKGPFLGNASGRHHRYTPCNGGGLWGVRLHDATDRHSPLGATTVFGYLPCNVRPMDRVDVAWRVHFALIAAQTEHETNKTNPLALNSGSVAAPSPA